MKKLYRSQRDKKLFGICGGLAELLRVDATLLRLVMVVTAFFSGGTLIPIYLIAALVIPKEPGFDSAGLSSWNSYGPGPQSFGAQNGFSGSYASFGGAPKANAGSNESANLDHMVKDIENKAMWNEIQDLKAKLAKYEKGDV